VLVYEQEIMTQSGARTDRKVIVLAECAPQQGERAISRGCGNAMFEPVGDRVLVELMQGATDAALYGRVKALVQGDAEVGRGRVLFEGPRARDPRTVSEVFYVGDGNRSQAEAVAARLLPVTGPMEVKPWPGEWDYDVVVVVGAKVVEPPAEGASRP
jgi:hypothetical protein